MKLTTPFAKFLPPLSTDEMAALAADIRVNGVRTPIDVTENGIVLDGHHRLKICPKAPTNIVKGLSEAEAEAYVYRSNFNRRNLSPSVKKELLKAMKKTAAKLRKEDKKKWTQANVAKELGVAQNTVSAWFGKSGSNIKGDNTSASPDARVKIPPKARPRLAARVAAGERMAAVAADYGISERQARAIAAKEVKAAKAKADRAKETARVDLSGGFVRRGDFRKLGKKLADDSIDLIFTDPPYDAASASLYGDLAELAATKLRPGGWCLAYSGHAHLPGIYDAMGKYLQYGWTFAIFHTGGDLRFRKLKIQNGWKPILGFYRPPLKTWWDWFGDTVSGGKEKGDHAWQQAESEAAHFIDKLSPDNALIVDLFTGSGTTGVAAVKLGRSFIGFEADLAIATKAEKRIHDASLS